MASFYTYQSLREHEIRLVQLWPGLYEDPLYLSITHESLSLEEFKPDVDQVADVHNDLPDGLREFRTPEGYYFYVDVSLDRDKRLPDYSNPKNSTPHSTCKTGQLDCTNTCRDFEALSYVWGSGGIREKAFVVTESSMADTHAHQDREGPQLGHLLVGANLALALRHSRYQTSPRRLWVDALCINQEDKEERASQVNLMGSIYRSAMRVVVWLGLEDSDTALAFEILQAIGGQVEIAEEGWLFPAADAHDLKWAHVDLSAQLSALQEEALLHIFMRPWFSRVWTLQEITLASGQAIIQCGRLTMPFRLLRRAVAALGSRPDLSTPLTLTIEDIHLVAYGPARATLTEVLETMRSRGCLDARDKIYGCLNIVGSKLARTIQPSYHASILNVYRDAFLKYSNETCRLDLLSHCVADGSLGENAPSWIPSWLVNGAVMLNIALGFQAAGLSEGAFTVKGDDILEVKGVPCGKISSTSPPSDAGVLRRIQETQPETTLEALNPFRADDRRMWTQLLIRGCTSERFPRYSFPSAESLEESLITKMKNESSLGTQEAVSLLRHANTDNSFFYLDTAYLGIAAGPVQPGDRVYVLPGCWTPMILRRMSTARYKVVGRCFIPGLMDAEALLGPLPKPWRVQQWRSPIGHRPEFLNEQTNEITVDDPRLEPLSHGWERYDGTWSKDQPEFMDFFINRTGGEIQNFDPRMSLKALVDRGVPLEDLALV